MDKEKHRKVTELLVDELGGKGVSNILAALLMLFGVALFATGYNMPASTETKELGQIIVMLSGFVTMLASSIYGKLSTVLKELREYKISFELKMVSAFLTLYLYGAAFGMLINL